MKNRIWIKMLLTTVLLGGALLFWRRLGSFLLADIYSNFSEKTLIDLDFSSSLGFANKAIALNPMEPAYYRRRAKILLLSQDVLKAAISPKELALEDMKASIELNSKDLATLRNVIPLFYYLSLANIFEASSMESPQIDKNYNQQAIQFYNFLAETYSTDAGILVSLASYQKKLGLKEELNQTLHQIEILRPDLLEWHPLLIN